MRSIPNSRTFLGREMDSLKFGYYVRQGNRHGMLLSRKWGTSVKRRDKVGVEGSGDNLGKGGIAMGERGIVNIVPGQLIILCALKGTPFFSKVLYCETRQARNKCCFSLLKIHRLMGWTLLTDSSENVA